MDSVKEVIQAEDLMITCDLIFFFYDVKVPQDDRSWIQRTVVCLLYISVSS